MTLRALIRRATPPMIADLARSWCGEAHRNASGITGDYRDWGEALAASTGYDGPAILDKTKAALLQVKNGQAAYERDSVLFDRVEYSWPVLAGLLWVAARSGGRLNVLDFGGSLGSTYFQNRTFISGLREVRWNIVEQPSHVAAGRESFEDSQLRFYESIEACLADTTPNVALLSGVLQYVEHPREVLRTVLALGCQCTIIDRTPFWNEACDRLAVQRVDAGIFAASYPMWIFSLRKFQQALPGAGLVEEFRSFEDGLFGLIWQGFILGAPP